MPAKKILLMRHAKPVQSPGLEDFVRPLTVPGKHEAVRMGKYLKDLNLIPGRIISSTAARAKFTALRVAKELAMPSGIMQWQEELYYGSAKDYLQAIRQADEEIVMTVGHNPMTEQVIRHLSDKPFYGPVSPGSVAFFKTAANDDRLDAGSCRLLWLITPAELNGS